MLNTVLCSWVVKPTEVFFQWNNCGINHGKTASNPGMFWILCASHKQFNLLASIVKKRMRKPWGEAVDVAIFYGRTEDLATLEQWILGDRCRLVVLLGMGGIGKTSLTAKLGERIQGEFEYVVWRSLREAPPLKDILSGLLQFLSNQQGTERDLPESMSARINKLLEYLRNHRCLLILDNAESILQEGKAGVYREGYEGYGELLRRVGESAHQSCVVVTSREKPRELLVLEGDALPVRCWQMRGVQGEEGRLILAAKGMQLADVETQTAELVQRCGGNPLALKLVATTIRDLFDGDVAEFLQEGAVAFAEVRDLLDQHFERLSELEQSVMYWLAINREPVSVRELLEDIVPPVQKPRLLEALRGLVGRSLVEKNEMDFMLQNVVMECVTDRLIERMSNELSRDKLNFFNQYALIKATAKDYVRETQVRLILCPVTKNLTNINIKQQAVVWLERAQDQPNLASGYVAGNLLNLFCQMNTEIRNYNFSHLTIRQAYLQNISLYSINFSHADLTKSVFTQNFGVIFSLQLSPDGKILAGGGSRGEIQLWQIKDIQKILTIMGGSERIWSVTFSLDGKTLTSVNGNYEIRTWDVSTGQCLSALQGFAKGLWASIAFTSDNQTLAIADDDYSIGVWRVTPKQCLHRAC